MGLSILLLIGAGLVTVTAVLAALYFIMRDRDKD